MTYSPASRMQVPPMVSADTPQVSLVGVNALIGGGNYSSAGWPTANCAFFYPIIVPSTCVVRRLWWANGATVSATYNIDCGVYADAGYKPGARLVSTGSTAQGTASQVQYVDVTDTTLPPGQFWLALVASSTSATIMRLSMSSNSDAAIKFMQTSALPLPSTATVAESDSRTLQLFGFATTASP